MQLWWCGNFKIWLYVLPCFWNIPQILLGSRTEQSESFPGLSFLNICAPLGFMTSLSSCQHFWWWLVELTLLLSILLSGGAQPCMLLLWLLQSHPRALCSSLQSHLSITSTTMCFSWQQLSYCRGWKQIRWEGSRTAGPCIGRCLLSAGTAFPRWLQGRRQEEMQVCLGVFLTPH